MGLKDDKYQVLIPKNTAIPSERKDIFITTEDNQTQLNVSVYEGENEKANVNRKVMDLQMGPLDKAKAGEIRIEVSYCLDANNVLTVELGQLEREIKEEKEVDKVVPQEQGLKEKLKFWKEVPMKTIKVKQDVYSMAPGKKLEKINLSSPYKNLDPKIKNNIKELVKKVFC